MNKNYLAPSAVALSLLFFINSAFAAPTYPYSPSEALDNFETAYKPVYDQINIDLQDCMDKASLWSSTSALQSFVIGWASDTENGYSFKFIDVNDKDKALSFSSVTDEAFSQSEITRSPDMAYGIYSVPLRLRDLVPAMKTDKYLLPLLEQLIDDDRNVSIKFTLLRNSSGTLVWRILFSSSRDAAGTQAKQDYLVSVDAVKTASPVFSVLNIR